MSSVQSIEKLSHQLQAPDPQIRKLAVSALVKLQSNEACEALKLAENDQNLHVRYYARNSRRLLQARLLENLRHADESSQIDTIKMLGEEKNADACDFLTDYFDDAPMKVQIFISQSLGLIGDKKALPFLVERFRSGRLHEFVVSTMVKAIGRLGTVREISLIAEKLTAEDARLRANTIEALEFIGDKRIVELVEPMLQDPDPRVKTYAARVFLQFGDRKMLEKFEALLESEDREIRENAIWALGESGNVAAIKLLKQILSRKQDQAEVLNAIGKILVKHPQDDLLGIVIRYARHYSTDLVEIAEKTLEEVQELMFDEAREVALREGLAELLIRKLAAGGLADRAVDVVRKWLQVNDNTPELQEKLVKLLMELHNWHEACVEAAVLSDTFPEKSDVALELLESMTNAGARLPEIYLQAARIGEKCGNVKKAAESRAELAAYIADKADEFNAFVGIYLMRKVLRQVMDAEEPVEDKRLAYMSACYRQAIQEIESSKSADMAVYAIRLREILNNRFSMTTFDVFSPDRLQSYMRAVADMLRSTGEKERRLISETLEPFWHALRLESRIVRQDVQESWMDLFSSPVPDKELKQIADLDEPLLPVLGRLYIENGDYAEAIRMFEAILAINPEKIESHEILANLYKSSGNRQEMLFELKVAADLKHGRGDLSGARAGYSELIGYEPSEKEYRQAYEKTLIQILERNPEDPESRLEYAAILEGRSEYRKSAEQYMHLIDHGLEGEKAEKGLEYVQQMAREAGDQELELHVQEYCVKKGVATDFSDYLYLIDLYRAVGKFESLSNKYADAVKKKAGDLILKIHAAFLVRQNQWTEAAVVADSLDMRSSINKVWLNDFFKQAKSSVAGEEKDRFSLYLAEQEMKSGNAEKAVMYMSDVIGNRADDLELLLRYADMQFAAGMKQGASGTLRKICRLQPDNHDYTRKLAAVLEETDVTEAVQEYSKLLMNDPKAAEILEAMIRCGNRLISLGLIEDGAKTFSTINRISPENEHRDKLASMIDLQNDYTKLYNNVINLLKIPEFDRAVEALTDSATREHFAPLVLGLAENMLEMKGAPKGAVNFLMAETLSRSDDYQKAVFHYDHAMKISPDIKAASVKGVVYCYMKMELYEKAYKRLSSLELARKKFDDYVKGLYYEVGNKLREQGKYQKSRLALRELFSFDPHFRDVGDLIRELESMNE